MYSYDIYRKFTGGTHDNGVTSILLASRAWGIVSDGVTGTLFEPMSVRGVAS